MAVGTNPHATIARVVRRTRSHILLATLAVAAVATLAAGCGGSSSLGDPAATAVTIGSVKITNGEVERRAAFLASVPDSTTGKVAPPAKDSDAYWQLRRTAAEQLRDQNVMAILADRCGAPCKVTDADVKAQLDSIVQQQFNGSAAALATALKDRGITSADLDAQLKSGLQEQKLIERQIKGVTFTQAQAQAYYDKNRSTYTTPAQKRLFHILLGGKAAAVALRPQLSAANFAEVAKQRSIDTAAKTTGGDLGPVTGAGLIPEVAAAASTLKPGVISQPVESQFGWHLLMVRDVPASTKPFSAVESAIISEQLQVAQNAKVQVWRDGAVKKLTDTATFANSRIAPVTTTATTATTAPTKPTTATTTAPATTTTAP